MQLANCQLGAAHDLQVGIIATARSARPGGWLNVVTARPSAP
jgi:hypothetical protein